MKTSKKRKRAVQVRARRIMERRSWGYGKAMRRAGWEVARSLGER